MTTPEPAATTDAAWPPNWWSRPIVFVAGLAAILGLLSLASRSVYLEPNNAADRKLLAEMRKRHVLLLGTSHGHDVSLSEMGFDGVDLTHGGQDLFEMAYMARTVKKRSPLFDTLVISLSYFSFNFDNAAYTVDGVRTRVGRRLDLYTVFPRLTFIPGDSAEYVKGRLYPIVTLDHYQAGFKAIWDRAHGRDVVPLAVPAPPVPPDKTQAPSWFKKHAKRRCQQFRDFARNMSEHHPGLAEDAFASTLALAREMQAAKVRVIFVTPPYTRQYNDCFEKEYVERTLESGRRLATLTGASYFDFSHDDSFVDRRKFFEDSDHLNERGRVAFSRRFKQQLEAAR